MIERFWENSENKNLGKLKDQIMKDKKSIEIKKDEIPEITPSTEDIKNIEEIKNLLVDYFKTNSVRNKFIKRFWGYKSLVDEPINQIIELLEWKKYELWKFNKIHFYTEENLEKIHNKLSWNDHKVWWFEYEWELYLPTWCKRYTIIHEFYHIISKNDRLHFLNTMNLDQEFIEKLKLNYPPNKTILILKEEIQKVIEQKKVDLLKTKNEHEKLKIQDDIIDMETSLQYADLSIMEVDSEVFNREEILARFFSLRLDLFQICGIKMWDKIKVEDINKLKEYYKKNWYWYLSWDSFNILESISTEEDIIEMLDLMNNKIVDNSKINEEIRNTA